jgi:hypothetical protein
MSARDLQDWLSRAAPALAAAGVAANLGRGPNLGSVGATWISFSSPWGAGRLVRSADGGSWSTAMRNVDGTATIDRDDTTTTSDQLDAIVHAVSKPPPVAPAPLR